MRQKTIINQVGRMKRKDSQERRKEGVREGLTEREKGQKGKEGREGGRKQERSKNQMKREVR